MDDDVAVGAIAAVGGAAAAVVLVVRARGGAQQVVDGHIRRFWIPRVTRLEKLKRMGCKSAANPPTRPPNGRVCVFCGAVQDL